MKAQQFSFSASLSEATYMYIPYLIAEAVCLYLVTILFTVKELSIKKLFLMDSTALLCAYIVCFLFSFPLVFHCKFQVSYL